MVSHDIAAIQQTSHRMIFLEEKIGYDGGAAGFLVYRISKSSWF